MFSRSLTSMVHLLAYLRSPAKPPPRSLLDAARFFVYEDPVKGGSDMNLEYAKRMIDLLDLLKDRTQGRLRPAEFDFLDGCLSELKLHYVQKAEILKV
ncbi:MAG: DUF1844 domain-containing protein [Candidatus Aminicenantes bacterium]|nr:DUF1844 domain-containing protein [Candidatus Aminicenantes bacterium]